MAFDCVAVDFGNSRSKSNLAIIKNYFPNAVIVPFVESYLAIAKAFLPVTKTEHQWMLSSKVDYTGFDFDYIPEQHESSQLHVWAKLSYAQFRLRL